MAKSNQSANLPIKRITVDERLGDNHVRLLIAEPVKGVKNLADGGIDIWDEEESAVCGLNECLKLLGIGKDKESIKKAVKEIASIDKTMSSSEFFENIIKEGQVFLVGIFRIVGNRHEPKQILPGKGGLDFLRIDRIDLFKNGLGELYNRAVIGGGD